jgi:hypothetical protein
VRDYGARAVPTVLGRVESSAYKCHRLDSQRHGSSRLAAELSERSLLGAPTPPFLVRPIACELLVRNYYHAIWPEADGSFSTTLCLLHRAHMPPATSQTTTYRSDDMAYPSRTIAFQAAGMITSIIENLQAHDELRFTPAFV